MKVGVKVNAPIGPVRWRDVAAMAVEAEESGLDSLWSEDHHFEPFGGPWDLWTILAALAAVTSTVSLGSVVASTNFYPSPVILARKAATVHEISGGRLIFGLGAGSAPWEYARLGLPFDHPVSRFEEAFEVIRRLFAGERFDFHGRFHDLEDAWLSPVHRMLSPGHDPARFRPTRWLDEEWESEEIVPLDIPFMAGTLGPRMLRLMLPHVAGWNVHWGDEPFMNRPENLPPLLESIDEHCREAGRDPSTVWRSAEVYMRFPGARGLPMVTPPDLEPLEPTVDVLAALAEAGVDHAIVLVDPQAPGSVESLASVVAEFRSGV